MTGELIARTTLLAAGIVLCALGVWHNDKMVAFEDWLLDRAAYFTAMAIVKCRKKKIDFKIWLILKQNKFIYKLLRIEEIYIDNQRREEVQDVKAD